MVQRIMLIGFGTVGQGLVEILLEKKDYLKQQYNYEYEIVAISDIVYGNVYNSKGLDITACLGSAKRKERFTIDLTDMDTVSLIRESNADVICEMTFTNLKDGQPAIDYCQFAFKSGKSVVTSNKGPAALKYKELCELARQYNVKFKIEGTVLSGTPVINLIEGPLAGCEIFSIRGILNGTSNYILSEMEAGKSYDEALKKAQELGYAEADPTGDVEGYDARAKLTILANLIMNTEINLNDIKCEGITKIRREHIQKAKEKAFRWKLIAVVEKRNTSIFARVSPQELPLSHPLANIMGNTNAITITTDLLGDITIVGPGAGRKETGFAILTDLLDIYKSKTK